MSNVFRAQLKKLNRTKGTKTKSTVNIVPSPGAEKGKKKALSVSTPPEIPSPNHHAHHHQMSPRKSSVGADSPSHSTRTPTSPLVIAKSSSMASMVTRRDSNSAPVSVTAPPSTAQTPTSSIPLVPRINFLSDDVQSLDRQGIIDITADVQNFLAAIARLKEAQLEAEDVSEEAVVGDDERESQTSSPSSQASPHSDSAELIRTYLSDLIQIVHTCLDQHLGMQSTVIKDAAKNLTDCYQNCSHTSPSSCPDCTAALEHLIDAFTNSVSEYLTGDSVDNNPSSLQHRSAGGGGAGLAGSGHRLGLSASGLKGFSKSQDNLTKFGSVVDLTHSSMYNEPIVDEIDQALMGIEHGVEVATRYLKMRLKYHKEIVSYLSKRAQIEARYFQDMSKLGKRTHLNLEDLGCEDHLPLMELFKTSIDQDTKFASNSNQTYNSQVERKIIEPLELKMAECEKLKKDMTSTWQKQMKKLNEAKSTMKNAKSKYRFLGQDLSRVKNLLAMDPYGKQADKRKKEVSDLEAKWQDAEIAYKNSVAECNVCQYQVHVSAQKSILCAYRRQVMEFDMTLRDGLDRYFTLQLNFFKGLPDPMSKNIDEVRDYEVGQEFMRYIKLHPEAKDEPEDYLFEEYDPEAELLSDSPDVVYDNKGGLPNSNSAESNFLGTDDHIPRRAASPQPWDGPGFEPKRLSSGNTPSPRATKKKPRPRSMAFLLEPNQTFEPLKKEASTPVQRRNSDQQSQEPAQSPPQILYPDEPLMSKNAVTHSFRKLRGPARCRECDNYVYFNGHECETCGLACHKKCLATLAIRCGTKRLAKKMTTFGVDFQKHLKASKRNIPIIVTKCINEIDERGLDTHGLYRISSAKTKLEHLCQLFESGIDRVDLSDRPAHLIGSCLKLYFRQLPEPLLTFGLYQEFITFAREASHLLPIKLETAKGEKAQMAYDLIERLKGIVQKLPSENYVTLARLLFHLHRVGAPEHVKRNSMPPSNLGIVFGPNLLRQRDMVASLALLADMTAQAKAIEILIFHAHDVFNMSEERIKTELENVDDSEVTEVLVDEPIAKLQSPQLDIDDATTAGSRTPFNTPPERRRENVFELGDIIEALQSVGRRNSQPLINVHKAPLIGEVRDSPMFTSMPEFNNIPRGLEHTSSDDTLSALGRYLRPSPGPLEKMLTPVEERPGAEYDRDHSSLSDDGDQMPVIIPTSSDKLDSTIFSRSLSGVASPPKWELGDTDSDRNSVRDSTSILSSGYGTPPPRSILNSTNSMDITEISQAQNMEDLAKALENHDEKASSQGSDDSSTFSESVSTTHYGRGSNFNNIASPQGSGSFSFSSAEGTPVRTMSETRKRHPARQADARKQLVSSISDSTTQVRSPRPRSSPHSSAHSSMSGVTMSSQSSLGEEGINSDTSERRSRHKMKYGKYERYERYDKHDMRERSQSFDASPGLLRKKVDDVMDLPSDNEPPLELTQDSSGTLTDGNVDSRTEEIELLSSHSVTSMDSFYQNVNGQSQTVINTTVTAGEQFLSCGETEKGTLDSGREKEGERVSDVVKDNNKTHDSGIDDTTSPVYRNSEHRETSICGNNDENDIGLPDGSKPASYKLVFASRDSMLTDSPDTDSLNDDYVNSKVNLASSQRAAATQNQRRKSPAMLERQIRATSEDSEPSVGSPAHVELIIEDGKPARLYEQEKPLLSMNSDDTLDDLSPEVTAVLLSDDDEDSFNELERSGSSVTPTAPRSLEGPTFSRYARVPIRNTESKSYIRATDNPLYDTSSSHMKYRAHSMNALDEVSSSEGQEEDEEIVRRSKRATSESRTDKSSLTHKESQSSLHSDLDGLPQSLSAINLQSSAVGAEADDLHVQVRDKAFGGSLRLEKKNKKGKGFVSKLKPALRVLKITPSSNVESKKSQGKVKKSQSGEVTATSESADYISSTPVPRPYEEVRRMRMMSPEVMSAPEDLPAAAMRRSHSSDDILDHSRHSEEISVATTKVGPVYVIPEPAAGATKSKRRKFLSFPSKSKDRSKSRESSRSPVVLVSVQSRNRRESVEQPLASSSTANGNGTIETNPQKSPKSKRRRYPHFV